MPLSTSSDKSTVYFLVTNHLKNDAIGSFEERCESGEKLA